MAKKTLKDILGEGYLDDMQTSDTVDFVKKHTIDNEPAKKDKKVGTDNDEVFKASNVKQVKRAPRHGHDTEKSKDVYEALDSDVTSPSSMGISAPSYAVPTPKKRPEDLKTNSEKPVIPNTAGNSAVTKTGPQSSTVKKNTIDVNTRKVSEEVEEKEDYSDLVKKHLDAANKAKEYMDKGDLKNAKKHVEIMKDLSKQMAEEVELISELDLDTYKSYKKKSGEDSEALVSKLSKKFDKKTFKKFINRRNGQERVVRLAGKKVLGEQEVEHDDDGWYAHREIHGNKGISREDWKKGWRLNLKGERVQTKKANEEIEQIDELGPGTLMSYGGKAMDSAREARKKGDRETASKRSAGMERAASKLFPAMYKNTDKKSWVHASEEVEIDEKTLTPPEMKKRKEIADAIKREHPEYSDEKKMKIATAQAIKVAESSMDSYLNAITKVDSKRPFDGKGDSASNIQEFKNPGFGGKDEPYSGRNLQPSMNQKNIPDALRVTPEVSKPKPSASAEPKVEPKKPEVSKPSTTATTDSKPKPEVAPPKQPDAAPAEKSSVEKKGDNLIAGAKDKQYTDRPIGGNVPGISAQTKDQTSGAITGAVSGDKAPVTQFGPRAAKPQPTTTDDKSQDSDSDQKKSTNIFKLNRTVPVGKKESTAKEIATWLTPYGQKAIMKKQKEQGVEPKGGVIYRNSVSEAVWDNPPPNKKSEKLTPAEKIKAKARAKAAGRPYPNLIDNMAVAKESVEENSMDNELSEALKTASNRLNYYHTEIGKLLKGIESGLNQIKKSSDHHKDYKGEKGPNWGHVGTMSDYHKTLSDLHDRIHQQGEYMIPSVMKEESEQLDELKMKTIKDYRDAAKEQDAAARDEITYGMRQGEKPDLVLKKLRFRRSRGLDIANKKLKGGAKVMATEESEQNTAAQVASNKHLKAAAQALALAKGVGKNHPDYNTYMAMYASHRKKMMGEEIEQIYEASRSAVHAAWNGEEDKFHKLMGITDSTAKNHPDYVRSKKKYKELRAMGDGVSIADAMKKLNEEVEVIDEAIRTIGTHKSEDGNHIAKVRRDVENNEYRVELHSNGKHQRDADYFTDDEDDAHSTAEHMVAHAQKNSKKMTSEAIITLVKNIKNKKAGISDEAMQKKKQ